SPRGGRVDLRRDLPEVVEGLGARELDGDRLAAIAVEAHRPEHGRRRRGRPRGSSPRGAGPLVGIARDLHSFRSWTSSFSSCPFSTRTRSTSTWRPLLATTVSKN